MGQTMKIFEIPAVRFIATMALAAAVSIVFGLFCTATLITVGLI